LCTYVIGMLEALGAVTWLAMIARTESASNPLRCITRCLEFLAAIHHQYAPRQIAIGGGFGPAAERR
jgi:hypothetical protein